MADYNTKGEPTLRVYLKQISKQISDLEVTDPRLDMVRRQLFDLSLMVERLEFRVDKVESNQTVSFHVARALLVAVFVIALVVALRFI
jgi:hypothetical protein